MQTLLRYVIQQS